ncbi:hypothetical protein AO1008_08644 [Aspergillus oryzae 100-8]|uniref:Fumarylacetoacetase-like C-terminal domain-containing protein n=1 Tax=Aspergillus oryzae (strain 3.042) TaxID=1160506 RepID=I7ZMX9_ASPO3|nr:hypothetical protein Ao3042_10996 [Aspergillus oryzae 3.042]KDE82121.1 hypothetical protein AO1008_08644 [Aspergillus oryzae 100-8]|eukprot:EIT73162.1 hypothetical protein Ao3042_10996 [Aspergillus oryzae 3.042]
MAAFQSLVRFAVGDRAHYRGLIEAVDGKYKVQRFDGTPFDGVVKTNEEHEVETLLSPIENTPNVIYIGLNYKAHAQESKLPVPTYPPVFTKPADALAGPFEKIEIHPDAQPLLDYEDAKNVTEEEALDYVLGYTAGNGHSPRDISTLSVRTSAAQDQSTRDRESRFSAAGDKHWNGFARLPF